MTATAAAETKGRGTGLLSLFTLGATPSGAVRGGLQIASLLIPLLAWAGIASLGLVDEKFLPSPGAVPRRWASVRSTPCRSFSRPMA